MPVGVGITMTLTADIRIIADDAKVGLLTGRIFGAAEALEKGLVRSVAHEIETHALNLRGVSADAREGISAFIGKRTPSFANRVPQDVPDVLSALPDPPYRPPNPTDSAS